MNILDKKLAVLAIPVVLGFGIAGADASGSSNDGPVQCRVEAKVDGGMIAFRGTLESDSDLSGSYTFRIESSGNGNSTNIRQAGDFSAKAGEEIHLGQASLSNNGQYEVKFEVTANGRTYECK
jgi:hypothetical protein